MKFQAEPKILGKKVLDLTTVTLKQVAEQNSTTLHFCFLWLDFQKQKTIQGID